MNNGDENGIDESEGGPEGRMGAFSTGNRPRWSWVRIVLLGCVALSALGLVIGVATGFDRQVWYLAIVVWVLATIVWLTDSYDAGTRAGRDRALGTPLAAAAVAGMAIVLMSFIAFNEDDGGTADDSENTASNVTATEAEGTEEEGTPDFDFSEDETGTPPPATTSTRTPRVTATESTATSTTGEQTYVVVEGDTLSSIAEQFGTTVNAIVRLNRLANANDITVGQELRIPASE